MSDCFPREPGRAPEDATAPSEATIARPTPDAGTAPDRVTPADSVTATADAAVPRTVPAPPAGSAPVPAAWVRLAEAAVFAAAAPMPPRILAALLPDGADVAAVLAALRAAKAGRGVELVDVAGGVQFRTAPDLAPALRKIVEIPRRLPRVAMETLAIIAWHQPVTRAEIEEIRGASLSQSTLDALLEADLVAPRGRRETPGRPTLWGTTPAFLARFGLRDLRELPRREELLTEAAVLPAEPPPGQPAEPAAGSEDDPGEGPPGVLPEASRDDDADAPIDQAGDPPGPAAPLPDPPA
jgi:segregation and condensation protein B